MFASNHRFVALAKNYYLQLAEMLEQALRSWFENDAAVAAISASNSRASGWGAAPSQRPS
jgi:hypothetical protein